MSCLLLSENGLFLGWGELFLDVKRIQVSAFSLDYSGVVETIVTYRKFSLKIPSLLRTVLSQFSAISIKILGSMRGFSLITPSQSEIPSLMDCLENIVKGMPTR